MSNFIPISQITSANLLTTPARQYTSSNFDKYSKTFILYNYSDSTDEYHIDSALFEFDVTQGKIIKRTTNNKTQWLLKLNLHHSDEIKSLTKIDTFLNQVDKKCNDSFKCVPDERPYILLKFNRLSRLIRLIPKVDTYSQQVIINPTTKMPEFNEHVVDYTTLENKIITCSVVFCLDHVNSSSGRVRPQLFVRSCMFWNEHIEGEINHRKSSLFQDFLRQNPDNLTIYYTPDNNETVCVAEDPSNKHECMIEQVLSSVDDSYKSLVDLNKDTMFELLNV